MVVIGLGSAGSGIVEHFSDSYQKVTIVESDFPKSCTKEEDFETNSKHERKRKKRRVEEPIHGYEQIESEENIQTNVQSAL